MYLPIWLHRTLMLLAQTLVGGLAFFFASALMIPIFEYMASQTYIQEWPWLMLLPMLVPLALARVGYLLMRSIFWNLIPARCSDCGGQAWCCGGGTVLYACSRCDFLHETCWDEKVSEFEHNTSTS